MKKILIVASVFGIIIACTNLSGETVKIVGINGKIKILKFNTNTRRIDINKTIPIISKIEGLSNFKKLEKLTISFSDLRNTDFTFLERISNLKTIEFNYVELKDLSFINKVPSLIAFSCFESVNIDDLTLINLSHNKDLEYLGLYIYEIDNIPKIINIPKSLKYIDFNFSKFKKMSLENLYLLSSYKDVNYIFSKDIEACMKKLNLDINLFDGESNEYDSLLKQFSVY